MAKAKNLHDPESVTEYIRKLEPSLAATATALRKVILDADGLIGEQIKWNAPSFFYTGALPAFNAREYKRDIAVMHLRRGHVLLIFPTGAVIADQTGLLEGSYADGRRLVTFLNAAAVTEKAVQLQQAIRSWCSRTEKLQP